MIARTLRMAIETRVGSRVVAAQTAASDPESTPMGGTRAGAPVSAEAAGGATNGKRGSLRAALAGLGACGPPPDFREPERGQRGGQERGGGASRVRQRAETRVSDRRHGQPVRALSEGHDPRNLLESSAAG